jgi:aspartate/methionine/tyrosine aminotransferase
MFASRTGWNLTINKFTTALEKHKKSGKQLLDLTASNPTECEFEYSAEKIFGALCSPAAMEYHPTAQGLQSARQAVANYYREKSISAGEENIFLTTSTSEAYSYIFRLLCEPGDEILAPRPSYPLFEFLANIQDVKLTPYSLVYDHGWQMDLDPLRAAVTERTRAIIVVNPNNPTGSYVQPSELEQLNRLCIERELALISDEVFHDYPLREAKRADLAANQEVLTFTLSGLSKVAGLPQMKVAWMVVGGPEKLRKKAVERLDVIADTYLSMNAPIQHALTALLDSRHGFQRQLKLRLAANLSALDTLLEQQQACTRLEVDAGWYAILRVPATRTDEELAVELLEECDVLVHPGHFFDFEQDGYLVVSLMASEQVFAEGAKRVLEFFG